MKRFIGLIFVSIIIFSGCSNSSDVEVSSANLATENISIEDNEEIENSDVSQNEESNTNTSVEDSYWPVTVIDDLGYEITINEKPQRVVIADLPPLVHTYYVANGGMDGLIGAPTDNALVDTMLPIVYPSTADLETGFRENGDINIEELMALEPDLILYRSDNAETAEIIRGTGVTAVAFQTYTVHGGNTVNAVSSWLDKLGKILGKEERAEEIKEKSYEMMGLVQSRMWNINEEDKTSMLYFNGLSIEDDRLNVSGNGLFGKFWAEIAEADDLGSKDINGAKVIDIEQLYTYNPDVIFLTFSKSKPEDLYADPLYAELNAVKEKRVYNAPLGMFSWYGPSTDVALSFLWHSKILYPEAFEDINVVELTKEHYKDLYDYDLTEDDINFLFGNSLEIIQ